MPNEDRLDSWKAIASYLDRDVSTVRRWEKTEGMPVHRHQHSARGSAYAFKSELSRWFEGRRSQLEGAPPPRPDERPRDGQHLNDAGQPAEIDAVIASAGTAAVPARRWGIAFGLVAVVAGLVWYVAQRPATSSPAFQARDWILIGEIENRTGDPRFDGTIEYALERELSESRFVNVIPRERVADTLRLMKRPLDARIDRSIGLEICLRDGGIRALLTGRVEKIGGVFVLSAFAVDPHKQGATMAAASARAADEKQILDAVEVVSDRLRQAVGEQAATIRHDARLERATTGSLRALQLYSQGMRAVNRREWPVAAELLQQAVAEDPDFASARIYLAHSLRNMRRPADEYLPHARSAADAADRTTDRERYFILGSYHGMVGDHHKALAMFETLLRLYPDDFWAMNNLSQTYVRLGRSSDSRMFETRLAALRPNEFSVVVRAAIASLFSGRPPDEIRALVARARRLDSASAHPTDVAFVDFFPAFEAWVAGDVIGTLTLADALRAKSPTHEHLTGTFHLALGQIKAAEETFRRVPLEGDRAAYLALAALCRGERKTLASLAIRAAHQPLSQQSLVAWLLLEAREFAELEHFYTREWLERELGGIAETKILGAELKLMKRVEPDVIADLDMARRDQRGGGHFRATEVQADAELQLGNVDKAAALMDETTRSQWNAGLSGFTFPGVFWLRVRAKLARVYRQTGRTADADRIDAEIAKLLALADPDFRLLP